MYPHPAKLDRAFAALTFPKCGSRKYLALWDFFEKWKLECQSEKSGSVYSPFNAFSVMPPPGADAIQYLFGNGQDAASSLLAKSKALLDGDKIARIPSREPLALRKVDKQEYAPRTPQTPRTSKVQSTVSVRGKDERKGNAPSRKPETGRNTGISYSSSVASGGVVFFTCAILRPSTLTSHVSSLL